jgi:hypothetical protein
MSTPAREQTPPKVTSLAQASFHLSPAHPGGLDEMEQGVPDSTDFALNPHG